MRICFITVFLFAFALHADMNGLKRFTVHSVGEELILSQSLDVNLNREFGKGFLHLDYDDSRDGSESIRSIKFNYNEKNNKFLLGDQDWSDQHHLGIRLKKTRGLSDRFSHSENTDLVLFFSDEEKGIQRDDFRGRAVRGSYYLSKTPVTEGSEIVFLNDRELQPNIDYTLDYEGGLLFFNRVISPGERISVVYRPITKGIRLRFFEFGGNIGDTGLRVYDKNRNTGTSGQNNTQLHLTRKLDLGRFGSTDFELAGSQAGDRNERAVRVGYEKSIGKNSINASFYGMSDGFETLGLNRERKGAECSLSCSFPGALAALSLRSFESYRFNGKQLPLRSIGLDYENRFHASRLRIEKMGEESLQGISTSLFRQKDGFSYFTGYLENTDTGIEYYYQLRNSMFRGGAKPSRLYTEHYQVGGSANRYRTSALGEYSLAKACSIICDLTRESDQGKISNLSDLCVNYSLMKARAGLGILQKTGDLSEGMYLKGSARLNGIAMSGRIFLNGSGSFARLSYKRKRLRLFLDNRTGDTRDSSVGLHFCFPDFECKFSTGRNESVTDSEISLFGKAGEQWNWSLSYEKDMEINTIDREVMFRLDYHIF